MSIYTYFIEEVFEMGITESFSFHVTNGIRVNDLITKCTNGHVWSLWNIEQFTSVWFGH